jgi:hypothetical protein
MKNAFAAESPCPVSLQVIETYIQILKPAYEFNLVMQKTESTIGDVVPSLMIIISKWRRFAVGAPYASLCKLLIKSFEHKFNYELNSDIYKVWLLL